MWLCVGLARTDVSEERVASIFKVEKIREREKCLLTDWTTVRKSTEWEHLGAEVGKNEVPGRGELFDSDQGLKSYKRNPF
jgi:hypothetical protein